MAPPAENRSSPSGSLARARSLPFWSAISRSCAQLRISSEARRARLPQIKATAGSEGDAQGHGQPFGGGARRGRGTCRDLLRRARNFQGNAARRAQPPAKATVLRLARMAPISRRRVARPRPSTTRA